MEEKSAAACALTSWRDRLYVAWIGTDFRVNLASSPDGSGLLGKLRLDQRSYKRVRATSSDDMAKTAALPASVAGSGERLHLAWTAGNGALAVLTGAGDALSTLRTVPQQSTESPSITTSARGDPVLAWTGTDRHVNLLSLAAGPSAAPIRLEEARSGAAPAVCGHRGGVVVAWAGSDRRVNLLSLADGRAGAPVRLEEARSGAAPAVCSHRGGLVVAWTGTDRRINLARLS